MTEKKKPDPDDTDRADPVAPSPKASDDKVPHQAADEKKSASKKPDTKTPKATSSEKQSKSNDGKQTIPDAVKSPDGASDVKASLPDVGKSRDAGKTPDSAAVAPQKRSGLYPALLGGILAAMVGFFLARSESIDSFLPGALKSNTTRTLAELQAADSAHSDALAALQTELAAQLTPEDLAGLSAQVNDLKEKTSPLSENAATQSDRMADLETRLVALEEQPSAVAAAVPDDPATANQLAELKAAIAAQKSQVEDLVTRAKAAEAEASAKTQNALTAAHLARLRAALDDGSPLGPVLRDLQELGLEAPNALAAFSEAGAPMLATLVAEFPPAARDALAAVRAGGFSDGSGGLGAFLQRQLGARSVEPRQGQDPDAILSRAEAAAIGGDLDSALAEISALPEPAQAAMSDWAARASARSDALHAADKLVQDLNTN